jgi:hypothetical protein
LVHKSKLLNWFKTNIDSFSSEDESEHVLLESKLIRAVSEYRKLDLESIHLSKDFDLRLMNCLENETMDGTEDFNFEKKSYKLPIIATAGFSLALILFVFFNFTSSEQNEKSIGKTNSGTDLIDDLKSNPEKVKFLKNLETYYFSQGKIEQANEIKEILKNASLEY